MAYTEVKTDAVKDIVEDWADRAKALKTATDPVTKKRLEQEMEQLGEQVKTRLSTDMHTIEQGFATHQANVAKWEKEAEKLLASAKQATARFKAKPTLTELPPQVTHFAKQIGLRATALDRDAHSYGDSWREYRANPWALNASVGVFPGKFTSEFMARRNVIINDQKAVGTSLEKIRAMQREADSLALVLNKASMKQGIKAGTTAQRPITDARKIAGDGYTQIHAMLDDLVMPSNLQPKPDSITQNAKTLQGLVDKKNWPKDDLAMKNYEGVWKNAEAGYKRIVTIEANMKKVAANVQKGLRSFEMKDATIKKSLTDISADLKTAATLLKTKTPDYNKAKSAYPKILAGYKAAPKAKK